MSSKEEMCRYSVSYVERLQARVTELEAELDLYHDSKRLVEANDSLVKRIAELEGIGNDNERAIITAATLFSKAGIDDPDGTLIGIVNSAIKRIAELEAVNIRLKQDSIAGWDLATMWTRKDEDAFRKHIDLMDELEQQNE